jgi:hypothetical protein
MSGGAESRLGVLVDGVPQPAEEAKALWKAFSEHMEAHRGDMAGFARERGWASVAPEYRQGKAILVVRTGAPPKKKQR